MGNLACVGAQAFPRCMNCLLSGSSTCSSLGTGSVIKPLRIHLHGMLFLFKIGRQY